jgi:hypothetical protein
MSVHIYIYIYIYILQVSILNHINRKQTPQTHFIQLESILFLII